MEDLASAANTAKRQLQFEQSKDYYERRVALLRAMVRLWCAATVTLGGNEHGPRRALRSRTAAECMHTPSACTCAKPSVTAP